VTSPAARLFVDFVDLLDALRHLHAEGAEADLQPLAQRITDLVDAMPRHAATFQLLSRVHDHRTVLPVPLRQAAITVDALHFGRRHGLSRRELLVLGLACSLAAVLETADQAEAAGELMRYRTLGALGPDVLDTVLTPYQLAAPEPNSAAAVYLLVDEFQVLRRVHAAPDALARLASGTVSRVSRDLGRQFALARGAWPVGTAVRLNNGRLALVIGWSKGQAHGRPVVQPLESGGALGASIDLADVPGIQIVEAVAASSEKLDLSRLHDNARLQARSEAFTLGRKEGPSVSLSYDLSPGEALPEESLAFDLSIEDSLSSVDSLPEVLIATLKHPLSV